MTREFLTKVQYILRTLIIYIASLTVVGTVTAFTYFIILLLGVYIPESFVGLMYGHFALTPLVKKLKYYATTGL